MQLKVNDFFVDYQWEINKNPQIDPKMENLQAFYVDENVKSITVEIPIQRYLENEIKFKIDSNCTISDLLNKVFRAYNEEFLPDKIVKKLEDDVFGYKRDALKKLKKGEKVKAIELIGDMIFFEGFKVNSDDSVYLFLGS